MTFSSSIHVAVAREDVDVRRRFPVGARLAAARVAEGEVDAGNFLVLQQVADHVAERDVGAEGELADAVAVLVGVAVVVKFAEILAVAVNACQPTAADFRASSACAESSP